MPSQLLTAAVCLLATAVLAGCAPKDHHTEPAPAAPAPSVVTEPAAPTPAAVPTVAHATIQSTTGVGGTVTFSEQGSTVTVEAKLSGVAAGEHGFHVHETGECTPPDYKSAGGHFNPTAAAHGAPSDAAHHAGDLGNITIAADGTGSLSIASSMLSVAAGPNSVVGKAVIVHEKADDLKTQPTGDAGGRVGCGVVQAGAPAA